MTSGTWTFLPQTPPGWPEQLGRLAGGFFHTAGGLQASGAAGEPFYAELRQNGEVTGVAAGVRTACRLDARPTHVYLPTLPAVRDASTTHETLDQLVRVLEADGAATVALDSFDALWHLSRPGVAPVEIAIRSEYRVPLVSSPDTMWSQLSAGHRRHIRRGERDGWQLHALAGSQARALLAEVQRLAADRAATRGEGYQPSQAPFPGEGQDPAAVPSGSVTFAAYSGRTPLAVAMIGWAARRAFYVMGGSTPEGYRAGASLWLHWRLMCRLADARFTTYNLGGTPATAESPHDASHGLYRFKAGFGSAVVPCSSARWVLSPTHERLHRLGGWLGSAFAMFA